ncbi:MAG: NAD(P)H-dependent oxidoreductase subunit E [Anaerolineae bacterium]|nr:NAD(P)H-dependent oxidoreductase subunit E [Anaerolineae bacterium]
MLHTVKKPAPPSEDRRWKTVDAAMRRYGYEASGLVETLHVLQESFGYVSEEALTYVATCLNLPLSKVYGVATFYSYFNLKAPGKHKIALCTGTTCYVKGAGEIVAFMRSEYGLEIGETSPDGQLSFDMVRCVGACGMGPVMVLDGEVVGKLTVAEMKKRIREWLSHDE